MNKLNELEKAIILLALAVLLVITTYMMQESRINEKKETTKQETIKRVCKDMSQAYPQTEQYGECVIRNSLVN